MKYQLERKENKGGENKDEFDVLLCLGGVGLSYSPTDKGACSERETLRNLVTYSHDIPENNLSCSSLNFKIA